MRKVTSILALVILTFAISACAPISKSAKYNMNKPVNCSTAQQDIELLEGERASTGKQIASGVKSVVPVAAVGNLLMGQYNDGLKVTTGQYNKDIDSKISQIQRTCGVG